MPRRATLVQVLVLPFAVSDRDSLLSLIGQLAAIATAFLIARFVMRSRAGVLLVSALGALGAMAAHIAVDGQGACVFLGVAPIIYLAAVAGRRDLRTL